MPAPGPTGNGRAPLGTAALGTAALGTTSHWGINKLEIGSDAFADHLEEMVGFLCFSCWVTPESAPNGSWIPDVTTKPTIMFDLVDVKVQEQSQKGAEEHEHSIGPTVVPSGI